MKDAALVMKPLTDALRGASGKKAAIQWTTEMERALVTIKKKMVAATCLAHPCREAQLVLSTNASGTHVGAALQQQTAGGALRPLGYFSKKQESPEQRYSAFDRELLAVYLAIRHFRWALEGRRFYVLTGHKPLTFALHRLGDAWSARQQRQLSYLAEYTSDLWHVVHRSGECGGRLPIQAPDSALLGRFNKGGRRKRVLRFVGRYRGQG